MAPQNRPVSSTALSGRPRNYIVRDHTGSGRPLQPFIDHGPCFGLLVYRKTKMRIHWRAFLMRVTIGEAEAARPANIPGGPSPVFRSDSGFHGQLTECIDSVFAFRAEFDHEGLKLRRRQELQGVEDGIDSSVDDTLTFFGTVGENDVAPSVG